MIRAWIILFAGAFSVFCAAMDFDWFMENRKARFIVRIAGRGGARIFYGVLGCALMGLAGWLLLRH